MKKTNSQVRKEKLAAEKINFMALAKRISEIAEKINGEKQIQKLTGKYNRSVYDCGILINQHCKVRKK